MFPLLYGLYSQRKRFWALKCSLEGLKGHEVGGKGTNLIVWGRVFHNCTTTFKYAGF
jgi:hypothetical protein